MTRRRPDSRLERALIGPARALAGYAAAIHSWPVAMWLLGDALAREPGFPTASAALSVLLFLVWRSACARQRRLQSRSGPKAGSARDLPAPGTRGGPPA